MTTEGFFAGLGEMLGTAIRFLVDLFGGMLGGVLGAVDDFFGGLARAVGMDASLFGFLFLALGLLLIYKGIRALLRRSFIGGLVRILLGLLLMSWLLH